MEKKQKSEEQCEIDILNFFTKCIGETYSDRRQVYFGQLCDSIFRWYENYVYKKAGEMGLEIINTVSRMVKNDSESIPKEKAQFFKYLRKSLENAKKEYHRNAYRNEDYKRIRLPRIVNEIEKFIEMRENSIGREITNKEKLELISKIFIKTEKRALEYLEMINNKQISSFDSFAVYDEPIDKLLANENLNVILDAVNSVLDKKQKRTRECNKALFTAYCICKGKGNDLEALSPVLDSEILEEYYKTMKKPLYSEIYMKYHRNTKKDSAEARASETIINFRYKLKPLLEKYQ